MHVYRHIARHCIQQGGGFVKWDSPDLEGLEVEGGVGKQGPLRS